MRKVIVLLAIFGLLVMVENKPALAWRPVITSNNMTPNLPAFDGLQELVDLLSDNGIVTSPLDLTLNGHELHQEGQEAGGLFLENGAEGVTFLPKPKITPYGFTFVVISDGNTHTVLGQDTITDLINRSFVSGFLLLNTANTAIHELLHAMVYRTKCFEGTPNEEEQLVGTVANEIGTKVSISLLFHAGNASAASRLQTQLISEIASNLQANLKWRGCYEILGFLGSWPMVGYDPQHTWSSPFAGPETSSLKWLAPFSDGGRFFSSVSIGMDGTILVAGSTNDPDGILYALNPDKSLKWQYPLNANLQRVSPAVGLDGTAYIGANGKLYTFLPDGSLKWDPLELGPAPMAVSSPVIASDGLIYVTLGFAGGLQKLFAVDPSGSTPAERIKWAYYPPADINGSWIHPVTSGPDGTIYALFIRQPPSPPGTELVALAPLSPSGSLTHQSVS